jgi:surface protein
MLKKRFLLGALFAGILASLCGGGAFAASGNTATISGGKTWEICVSTGTNYAGSAFVANITKSGFESQLTFDDFENQGCKNVKLAAGDYSVSLNSPMGAGEVGYEIIGSDKLVYTIAGFTNKYFSSFGAIGYEYKGSGGETTFPTVFEIQGECTFHGNGSNITGDTCIDSNGRDWTDAKYIDTNVALFRKDSEVDNASKDFEVYFEIVNWESSQTAQATLFNAKLEDASVYYPGFVMRIRNNANDLELTSRQGVNSSTDKKSKYIATSAASPVKIVRKNGVITYSFGGSEPAVLDDFSSFSRFFDQTAVFGASKTSSGAAQRIYKGTLRNMYIKLGKIEDTPKRGIATLDEGEQVNAKMKKITGTYDSEPDTNTEDENIKAIRMADALPANFDINNTDNIISSSESEKPIYAWYDNADNNGIIYIYTDAATMKGGEEMGYMFGNMQNLTDISALAELDTSDVRHMNWLFSDCYQLADISPLASWNTSNVSNMNELFYRTAITNVDALETKRHDGKDYVSWDMSSVEYMDYMFDFTENLTDISALASWDVSNVNDMIGVFEFAENLADISPLASWNTSNVESMSYLFSNTAITNVNALETKRHEGKDYVSWDISNVREIDSMFLSDDDLVNISALASWDTSGIEKMPQVFSGSRSLVDISPLASWDTSSATDMRGMFSSMTITNVDALETKQHKGKDYVSWDMSNVEDISQMFSGDTDLTDISALASWNTSSVQNMQETFCSIGATNLDALETKRYEGKDYISWDVSNVTNMVFTFDAASELTDISALASWDVSSVTDMEGMFVHAYSIIDFKTPLENWNLNDSVSLRDMFEDVSEQAILPTWYNE